MTDAPPTSDSESGMPAEMPPAGAKSPFVAGFVASWRSVFLYVLFATFIGIGALAHDFGFSIWWLQLSTLLVWAGPAQVILISILGTGGSPLQAGIAVTLSAVRLLPMVVSLLPLVRMPQTKTRDLVFTAHMTAISMWVEAIRLLPAVPRAGRIAFTNGLSCGYMIAGLAGGPIGFYLAGGLPPVFAAGLLFLTPMVFMVSVIRNSRLLVDQLAFALGLVSGPILAAWKFELDLVWSGLASGTIAFAVHRFREHRRRGEAA